MSLSATAISHRSEALATSNREYAREQSPPVAAAESDRGNVKSAHARFALQPSHTFKSNSEPITVSETVSESSFEL